MPSARPLFRPSCRLLLRRLPCLALLAVLSMQPPARAADQQATAAATARWSAQADVVFSHLTASKLRYATALAQDGQGFLWVGTQAGLVRWDGYRARVYQADPEDPNALPDNSVLSLHADRQGRLWVGTSAGGLARYDAERDVFVTYRAASDDRASATVSVIADDAAGGLWVGTRAGLDHLESATGVVHRHPLGGSAGSANAVMAIDQEHNGRLWVGTEHGLLLRAAESKPFVEVPLPTADGSKPTVIQLYRDSAGRLWIGTHAKGAFVIDPEQAVARPVRESGPAPRLATDSVLTLVEASSGAMWIGTDGGGIVVVEPNSGWRTRRLRHQVAVPTSLQDDDVSALFRDRSGLVWVATNSALSLHDPRHRSVSTLFGVPGEDHPITTVNVPFVLENRDGRVWLSLGNGGIDILDPLAGRVAQLRPNASRPLTALPKGRVLAMAQAADGSVYAGTRQGLYRADPQGRHVHRVSVPSRAADAVVRSLYAERGVLWVGGDDGLWAIDVEHGQDAAKVLRHVPREQLGNQPVTAMLRGAGNTLWVGTMTGLNRVDSVSGSVEPLPANAAEPHSLLPGYVASLLIDARGRLWVASVGSGIQVLESHAANGQARFHRLGTRGGLPHNGINMLLPDARGRIWASTDNGLAVIDPETYAVRTLSASQGVAIESYWSGSGARTAAGELLYGGQGGLTVVRPDDAERVDTPPAMVVTEARVGGKLVQASRFNSAGMPPRIDLHPEGRSLMVEFSALDYAAPDEKRYSYRLLGFDADWIATEPSRRLAAYTNLPPGDFTLQVRSADHEAAWTGPLMTLPIRVMPAWYQTAGFRLVAALAGLLAVAALVQLRTSYLRRRQHELQGLVALRTADLVQRGEQLRESQRQLEQLAYFDPLTGLPNRRRFNEDLRHLLALSLRGTGSVTLLLIDLDRFKQINDTLGHDAGDALLIEVARRLGATVRQTDRVARLGGDEFAMLLAAGVDGDPVDAVCRRVVEKLAQPVAFKEHQLHTSASVGVAHCPGHAAEPDALYKCADLALYDAKRSGRDTWRWYAPVAPVAAGVAVARIEA